MESCRGGCPNYHPEARPDPLLHNYFKNILPGSRLSPATIMWSLFGHYILESSPETAYPTSLMMWEACGAFKPFFVAHNRAQNIFRGKSDCGDNRTIIG